MKKFEKPTLELEEIEVMDVITTSPCTDDECWEDGAVCPNHI